MKLFSIGQACLAGIAVAAQTVSAATEPPSAYEMASEAMTRYCVAGLCLGMTIPEVMVKGELHVMRPTKSIEQLNCDLDHPAMKLGARYVAADNTRFRLTFDLVTPRGDPQTLYRLHFVAVEAPGATPAQSAQLTNTLINRFGATTDLKNGMWLRPPVKGEPFDLFVAFIPPGQNAPTDPPSVVLMAEYRHKKDWLMSLPECRAGMPKL